jgi:hypothetical protein
MRRNLALLAQDYGARALTPFQTAIDINVTWEGMARCAAQTQCYFIDSCRQASWTMQKQLDDPAVSLISPVFGVANDRDAPRFMATGPARSAYGMSDGVTMFTDILIESLKRGARKNRGRWVVTTQRLSEALCCAMPDLAEDDPTNPTRKLVRQVLGAISEYEKSLIVLKLRGARVRQRAKEGRCEGAKPYGFYEGEEAIVERMKSLRSSGMGFDRIAAQLNADGLKPRGGERWHGLVVNRILTGKGRAAEAKNA